MKKILYIGRLNTGDTSYERMKAMQELGYAITMINMSRKVSLWAKQIAGLMRMIGMQPDYIGLNRDIREAVTRQSFNIVWVDKGTLVKADTLKWIRQYQPDCLIVHLNPDDPFGAYRKGWNVFLKAIPYYDIHFVARTQNVEEFARLGGRNVVPYDRSYSKTLHRPITFSPEESARYEVPVGFIGAHAPARAGMIAHLIQNGIPVAVYGDGWAGRVYWDIIQPHHRGASRYGEEYVKTINGMGIALHFLRHENRDEQDSRTFEIPACGAFMLAERSRKHEALFRENEEAVFFDTKEDLLEKVRYYLNHREEARQIAVGGRQRCEQSGYDHHSRMETLLNITLGKSETPVGK